MVKHWSTSASNFFGPLDGCSELVEPICLGERIVVEEGDEVAAGSPHPEVARGRDIPLVGMHPSHTWDRQCYVVASIRTLHDDDLDIGVSKRLQRFEQGCDV